MNLLLNEDQKLLRDSARAFCQENTPLGQLRQLRDSRDATGFDANCWKQMVELGWAGMAIDESYGGFGFGYGGLGVVLEETGRTLTCSPLVGTVLMGANLIQELGSEEQKSELLPQVVSGELLLALALDEGPVHAPENLMASYKKTGSGFRLSGAKTMVLDGHVANKIIVVAVAADEGEASNSVGVFLVDKDAPGLSIERTFMVDSRNAAKLWLEDVEVPSEAALGVPGQVQAGLDRALDVARIGLAAEMLGSVQEVFERILDYLKQREQFGVLIGSFQALQHRCAEMYSEIELCVSAVRAGLAAMDDPATPAVELSRLASIAKAKLSDVFFLVSNEGIQMHGGIGMTDEFDIGFFIKRARVAQFLLGDGVYHRRRYASLSDF